jgi:hypothetical protein
VPKRDSDDLFRFSYRIFKIEYILIKLVFFALSLYGLYQFATRELGMNFSPPHTEVHQVIGSESPPRTPP